LVKLTPAAPEFAELWDDFSASVSAHQPELKMRTFDGSIVLEGNLIVSGPMGPFDTYEIRVVVMMGFPWREPIVFETANRIPRIADRHISEGNGDCCLGVWEEWLLRSKNHSAAAFINGPLHDYFLSQSWFETKGVWPFDDRSHGSLGILESYCDILDLDLDRKVAMAYLRTLSRGRVKGHVLCPCGSGLRLRNCHSSKLESLRLLIRPHMAKRMFDRLNG